MTSPYKLPFSVPGALFEKNSALADAKRMIDERGVTIVYYSRGESNIVRGDYNSRKRKSVLSSGSEITMKAFPINFSPIDKDIKKAGLRGIVDVIVYTAMQDWIDNNLNPENSIDTIRDTVLLRGKSYQIKEPGFVNQFNDTFLNVTLGLVLR